MAAATADTAVPTEQTAAAPKVAVVRKRAATGDAVPDTNTEKTPQTKRRRTAVAPKKSGKKTAPTKKSATKPPPTKKAQGSDSDSESESSSSGGDTEVAPASVRSPPSSSGMDTPARSPTPVADILRQPKRRLTDDAIDELVPLILRNERPAQSGAADDGKVVVVSSLKMQAVMQRFASNRGDVTPDNVHKLLGLTRQQIENADVVAVVVHGPHTESEARARLKYGDEPTQNYHWSLACWFRSLKNEVFHYDSCYPINDKRCAEVLGVLRTLGVLPADVHSYVLPDFFPQQEEEWECGYEALIALTILSSSPTPAPITENDVDTSFRSFFATLNADGSNGSLFIKRLRELLAREQYAF